MKMALITWIKVKALKSALDNMSVVKIADVITDFGKREFKDQYPEYLKELRQKLSMLVFELGRRY